MVIVPKEHKKQLLKKARECFDQNDYKETVKFCKMVLKEEKKNYNALVLMGAAMIELPDLESQVPTTLKKATILQPSNPLAWQGLATYFQKNPNNEELISIYCHLLPINNNPAKQTQYLSDISQYLSNVKDVIILKETVKSLHHAAEVVEEDERRREICITLATILTKHTNLQNEYNDLLIQILVPLIQDETTPNRQDFYKKYLKLLYKLERYNELFTEAARMHLIYSQDIYPLEWICRVYSEVSVINGSFDGGNVTVFYETLLDHDPESALGYFANAVHYSQTDNLIDARQILNQVVNVKPKWLHAWILLAEINLKLHCWEDVESSATHALKLLPENDPHNLHGRIDLMLIESLVRSSSKLKWKHAQAKLEEISNPNFKQSLLLTRTYVLLEDERAEPLLETLIKVPEMRIEATILQAIRLQKQKSYEEASDVLEPALESAESWLTLGKIKWDMCEYSHSLVAFLKAVRANPYNWECLVYLGHYHREHTDDLGRAKKCYQKALQINPNSDQAGIGLSLVYRLSQNSEANLQLLHQWTSQGTGPKWAWLQLGLQQLDHGNATQAITTLRNAVKIDPDDNNCWECLADAYLARGAHASALKSYEKASELNPESLYPLIQFANVKLLLGDFTESKVNFENVLKQKSNCTAALKGLAESYLGLARENVNIQLVGRARDNLQEAMDNLTKAVMQSSEFSCIWKLLGDVCFEASALPEKYCFFNVRPSLLKSDSPQDSLLIKRNEILLLSSRCYCRALSITKNSSLLWHDLARCYLAQVYLDTSVNREEMANRSLIAAKQAVKRNSDNWIHWNLLGVVCMSKEIKNYALAQHCFVVAIDKESNNAVSWANLGALYLLLNDPFKANEAFSWAQRADPAYINSWIGQGLIAEKVSQKEAMDLFRHSTQLGYHNEAAIGYTHWVLTTLLNPDAKKDPLYTYTVETMHAVTVATDAANWYTVHFPNDPCALNAYGLLLERQKLYKPASDVFRRAIKYEKDDENKDKILINLARILVRLGDYDQSIEYIKKVKCTSFASQCQLALALFKAKRFKESYDAYETALEWLADADSDKAHVFCAMAAMVYMFHDERSAAKTLFFQSISINKSTDIPGLLALAAFAVLEGDDQLLKLINEELEAHKDDVDYRHHIAKLRAYTHLVGNDTEEAVKVFLKFVHRHPDSAEHWIILARLLLIANHSSFSICARKALALGRNTSNAHIASIACISSLSSLINGNVKDGLRSVLKDIMSFPANVESWANLVIALMSRCSKDSQPSAHWVMVLCAKIRRSLPCNRSMEQWLLKNEKRADEIAYC